MGRSRRLLPRVLVGLVDNSPIGEGQHWADWPNCPCGCGVTSLKLTVFGHAKGCRCRPCTGRRSQKKGKAAQARTHQRLGGTGFTPSNEESARPYTITAMPEVKTGGQVPASWDKFLKTEWFRRALDQSQRGLPTGSGAKASVSMRGDFLIIDMRPKRG